MSINERINERINEHMNMTLPRTKPIGWPAFVVLVIILGMLVIAAVVVQGIKWLIEQTRGLLRKKEIQ